MFKLTPRTPLPTHSFPRIIRYSHLLLLSLSLLAGTLAAQTEQETKFAQARKLLDEGVQLFEAGSKDSLEQALQKLEQARTLFHSINEASGEALALVFIGKICSDSGQKQKALGYFNQALLLFHTIGIKQGEAETLYNIGGIYNSLGDMQKSLEYFNQVLPLFRALGDKEREATTLNNIGYIYNFLGEKQKALDYLNQSLPLIRADGNKRGEAMTLSNIGDIYNDLGEKQKALDYLNQALPLSHAVGDKKVESMALDNLGGVYSSLGEKRKALAYYEQSLSLSRAVSDKDGEATTLNNIGSIYYSLGEERKALDYFNQALSLSRAIGDKNSESITLNNIGSLYDDLGERQKALDSFNQSLLLSRAIGNKSGEATTLNNIGSLYNSLDEQQKALDYFNQVLPLVRAVDNKEGEARTLANIAFIEGKRGNLLEARTNVKAAIDIIESLRGGIFNQDLRSSYFSTVQDYYELCIDVLMRLHAKHPKGEYDGEALQVSERARARVLLETLAEAGADIRQGVDSRLVERERSLQRQLNASALRQTQLLNGPHSGEQAVALAKEIESLTTEFQQVEAQIRQTSPRYASLTQPQPLDSKAIRAQLDSDTLLLEYALGAEHSYLWLVSSNDVQTFELPAGRQIEAAAGAFIEALKTDAQIYGGVNQHPPAATVIADPQQRELLDNAVRLSRMLLGPVASQLGQKRLVIVGDGILLKLPFAALPDVALDKQDDVNAQPLILRHEVVSIPSVSALVSLRGEMRQRKVPLKELVVLADPVFYPDDVRVKRGSRNRSEQPQASANAPGSVTEKVEMSALETGALRDGKQLERLAATRKEADGIIRFVPTGGAEEALDFAANRELVNSGELGRYRYVHFATHALLNNIHPELTAIVLSLVDENGNPRDGFLRAHEIYNLNLTSDVVVLSACETGLGKEVRGEGLVGLTRGFMYAGSPRVVVSLWSVRDDSTAQLMVSFYRGMIKEGKRPAEALRAAQIEMLKGEHWQAPRYWAAFMLQGEWR
jgi:CHAT domain-containing protein/tetratricopeptide (TPR) repeat protein